jgi:hypothetical protein
MQYAVHEIHTFVSQKLLLRSTGYENHFLQMNLASFKYIITVVMRANFVVNFP